MARAGAPAVFERIARRLGGGRLVYGKPLRVGERAVIPVARVRMRGGFGFTTGDADGGGGGGMLDARPVGFIDVGPEGARYEAIPPEGPSAATVAGVAVAVVAGIAVARTAVGGRTVKRLARAGLPLAMRAVLRSSRRGRRPSPLRSLLR